MNAAQRVASADPAAYQDFGVWDEAKQRFPVGTRVRGIVTRHCPFGVFVDLGDPDATGLIQIVDFLDEGRMTPDQYPARRRKGTRLNDMFLIFVLPTRVPFVRREKVSIFSGCNSRPARGRSSR
jgi:hypothetical protein